VLKGKNAEFNLKGVLMGISFIHLASIALIVFAVLIIGMISPLFFSDLAEINNTALNAGQAMQGIQEIQFIEDSSMLMGLLMLAAGIFILYMLYVVYLVISVPRKDWIAKNIIILLLFIGGINALILSLTPF
jgi:hypothetical protein